VFERVRMCDELLWNYFLWCYLTLPKHPSSSNVQDKQQAQLRIVDVAQLRIVKKGPLDPLLKAVFSDQKKVT